MNLDALNKWLTFAANVGVIVGLILIAYELNQTQEQLEMSALADATDNFTQAMEVLVQDEDLSALLFRAESNFEELDQFEKWRVYKYLDGFLTMSEQDFLAMKSIEAGTLGGFEYDWKLFMKQQHYRAYWTENEGRFGHEFREYVNNILASERQIE
jgi:hypothetical protein